MPGILAISGLLLIALGAVTISARLLFRDKIARLVTVAVLGLPALAGRLARDRPEFVAAAARFWAEGYGQPMAANLLAIIYVALFSVTLWWLKRTETPRLLE